MLFISYRREDTLPIVGRMSERLKKRFGETQVFIDIDAIPIGVDFRVHIRNALCTCHVVLAIIGDQWLGAKSGVTARIEEPNDPVRVELEIAFQENIPVIPVLIAGAQMPDKEQLPQSLRPLVYLNAAHLDIGIDFTVHIERLISGIESLTQQTDQEKTTDSQSLPKSKSQRTDIKQPSEAFTQDGSSSVKSTPISRRMLLKTAGIASIGGALYYIGGNDYILDHLFRSRDELFLKDLVQNTKTGVLHHVVACADHLPAEANRSSALVDPKIESIHREKRTHIAQIVANKLKDNDAVKLLIAAIQNSPTSTHLYKRLISIWGKNKEYSKIHDFLAANIKYLEDKQEAAQTNQKRFKRYAKALAELRLRKSRAEFLASTSKASQT